MGDDSGGAADHDQAWLADRFEQVRPRLHAVARRMLGPTGEADDAVQEAWIRLSRSEADRIENLEAWLVTVVGRVALNQLRSRASRAEEPLDVQPDRVTVDAAGTADPEQDALLVDSVGLALQVVLDTLTPAERLAYVLHDMFAVPFDQIAVVLERSPESARQLASRGRRRIRLLQDSPEGHDLEEQSADDTADERVVLAFLAAARHGDFDALVAVLDPDVVQRTAAADGSVLEVVGAREVATRARAFALDGLDVRVARVGGRPGWVAYRDGVVHTVGRLTIVGARIATMDIAIDPEPGSVPAVELLDP